MNAKIGCGGRTCHEEAGSVAGRCLTRFVHFAAWSLIAPLSQRLRFANRTASQPTFSGIYKSYYLALNFTRHPVFYRF